MIEYSLGLDRGGSIKYRRFPSLRGRSLMHL